MANYINMNGTSGADSLTYNKAGTYYAYAGNDTIKINGGSGIVVYAYSGSNTIEVTGGTSHTIKIREDNSESDKINCNDKLTVNGANVVEGHLGSGKDIINLQNTDGHKTGGALSQIHAGAWGDTFNVENGTQWYQLYGNYGDDVFNINDGSHLICWGGAANDTFNVTGGSGIKLRGGDSADVFNISVDRIDIQPGYGNDIVNILAGDGHTIKANLGINEINLNAGSGHVITSDIDQVASAAAGREVGYGVDKVNIRGTATQVTANLGDGKDIVTISSGTKHVIFTEGWGDTIYLEGTAADSAVFAGAGDDIIYVSGGSCNYLLGQTGVDVFLVLGGDNNVCDGGSGMDALLVGMEATNTFASGDLDDDILEITGGSHNWINGNEGNDQLFLMGGENNNAGGDEGDDIITITGGDKLYASGNTGDDHLYVSGGNNIRLYGDEGRDTYWVNWDNLGTNVAISDYSELAADKHDKLLIYSENLNLADFSIVLDKDVATISNKEKSLLIINFGAEFIDTISFQNYAQAISDAARTYDIKGLYAAVGDGTVGFFSPEASPYVSTGNVDEAFKQINLPTEVRIVNS